jgi:hypothetical protein
VSNSFFRLDGRDVMCLVEKNGTVEKAVDLAKGIGKNLYSFREKLLLKLRRSSEARSGGGLFRAATLSPVT